MLGGKPNLIARRGNAGVIIDVKMGRPSSSHVVQVLVYMYAVPRAMGQHRGIVFDGRVAYGDHEVDVPAAGVDEAFIRDLSELVRRLSAPEAARRVPSAGECRFCCILSLADCPSGWWGMRSPRGSPRTSEVDLPVLGGPMTIG